MYPRNYAQYTLLERLATGGMSEVDLARRAVDDAAYVRFLVVKRIRANHADDDAFVRMFKDEARITSELRHTNIAQVYDFGRVEDEYYLALEYVPGTDLRALLNLLRAQRKRMPVRYALRFTADVLSALHYAHTRTDTRGRPMRIIHRDVNPRNIMVSLNGEVKLIDFGVARATDRLERTQTDHFKGKIAYMAPEQVKGDDLDHRVDLFALGLTLYEMLTGKGAFAGLDQTQILYRILQGQLPALDVPREWGEAGRTLASVLSKALASDPDERFADADAMRTAVLQVGDAFGGLPRQDEVASWVDELDPALQPRLHAKMNQWTGELSAAGELGESGAFSFSPAPTEEGSADTLVEASNAAVPTPLPEPGLTPDPGDETLAGRAAPVVLMAGLGTAGLVVVAGVALVVIALAGVAIWASTLPSEQVETDVLVALEPDEPVEVVPLKIWPPPPPEGQRITGSPQGRGPNSKGGPVALDPDPNSEPETQQDSGGEGTEAGGTAEDATQVDPDADTDAPSGDPTVTEPVVAEPVQGPPPKPEPPPVVAMGKLQVTASEKGLPLTINGKTTRFKTGQQFDWPEGRHTISAPGLAPYTVSVRAKMVAFVPLKPE